MDRVAVPRWNRKTNKENDRPVCEKGPNVKRDKQPAAPCLLNTRRKEGTLSARDARLAAGAQKRVKTFLREGAAAGEQSARSQAVLREVGQVGKDDDRVEQVPPPPTTAPSKLGVYKGKVVQSKIAAIWKTSTAASRAETTTTTKRSTIKAKIPNFKTDVQSTSVAVIRRPAVTSAVTGRRQAQCSSAQPPARPVHSKVANTVPRNFKKATSRENFKPSLLRTEKVNKPASSNPSQYRQTMETATERRAKLAGWLASKGKTLNRPPMAMAAPPKVSVKPKPDPKLLPQSAEPYNTQPCLEAQEPDSSAAAAAAAAAVAQCAQQEAVVLTTSQTPAIMNTTLELLESSDADLPFETQDKIDDIVVNLCDAMEAMMTPSGSLDEVLQVTDVCSDKVNGKAQEQCDGEQIENKNLKDGITQLPVDQKKDASDDNETEDASDDNETEDASDDNETEEASDDNETEDEAVQSEVKDVTESTPLQSASVVKYNLKTTPYLQSVKKTIEKETNASGSKRKSNIKDLKFLTPVRRSCRIERKSSRLPPMLLDHDPCVTTLAELVKMDDDPNAYIYRKNPALAEDLPKH